jgi:hypothetical protein
MPAYTTCFWLPHRALFSLSSLYSNAKGSVLTLCTMISTHLVVSAMRPLEKRSGIKEASAVNALQDIKLNAAKDNVRGRRARVSVIIWITPKMAMFFKSRRQYPITYSLRWSPISQCVKSHHHDFGQAFAFILDWYTLQLNSTCEMFNFAVVGLSTRQVFSCTCTLCGRLANAGET